MPHKLLTVELQSSQTSPLFKPSFWVREKKTSNAEVDLLWRHTKYLIPIEIKAGKTGRLRPLMLFMDRCDHHYAVRLYNGDLQIDEVRALEGKPFKLLNLPYF